MLVNHAAWMDAKHALLKVGLAPLTPPEAGQIVVRNRAVAINATMVSGGTPSPDVLQGAGAIQHSATPAVAEAMT